MSQITSWKLFWCWKSLSWLTDNSIYFSWLMGLLDLLELFWRVFYFDCKEVLLLLFCGQNEWAGKWWIEGIFYWPFWFVALCFKRYWLQKSTQKFKISKIKNFHINFHFQKIDYLKISPTKNSIFNCLLKAKQKISKNSNV